MSFIRKINSKAKSQIDTGFGANSSDYGGRFLNKDGNPNIHKGGVGFWDGISWYHILLQMPRWKFFTLVVFFYVVINLFFAIIYCLIGVDHLSGMTVTTPLEKFGEAYFFSAQTFTTVGYGRISPTGMITSTVAAMEALVGLLSFALATGLFYGRFSKPKAYIRFSENALLAPFNGGLAIMMRMASYKNNILTDAEAKITAGIVLETDGKSKNEFFSLDLEYSKVNSLTLSWTLVHPITEVSPFYKFTLEDFKTLQGELIVYVKAFDDMFSNTVVARTSYTLNELVIGAKFVPMYHRKDSKTILELDKLNEHVAAEISFPVN